MTAALQDSYRYLTVNQAQFLATLVNERFDAADDEGRAPWRERFSAIRTGADIDAFVRDIKQRPTFAQAERSRQAYEAEQRRAEAKANRATEPGLYVIPNEDGATGELYRITKSGWDLSVSKYSVTARKGARRLLEDGTVEHIERGKWTKLSAFAGRQVLYSGKLQAKHLLDDEAKKEWLTSFCNYCNRGLEDAESVLRNYGPKCAVDRGLPYGGLFEELLAQQQQARGSV